MTHDLATAIVAACRKTLPSQRPLVLHEPDIGELEQRYVRECVQSGWVSTAGQFVERFESELRARTGASYAIATVSGTSALHAALLAVGVQPGEEVLLPALTFVATANAVSYCAAVPHFVDACRASLGVDPDALEDYLRRHAALRDGFAVNVASGRRIRALIVMHAFGHPARMDGLRVLARRWKLELVEDAAESLGSMYRGRYTGTLGTVGVLSFNGNKTATAGGGGAVLTSEAAIAARTRHLCTTARIDAGWNFVHDAIGFNYRMPSLNAALGLAQLERLDSLLAAKEALARRYAQAFAGISGVMLFEPAAHVRSNHWLNTLVLSSSSGCTRDEVIRCLQSDGIHARPAWTPMHCLPMYSQCPRMPLPATEELAACIVNLPSSPALVMHRSSLTCHEARLHG
jgi:perosamine synthetase